MGESYIDIRCENHRLDACTIVLFGPGRGAAPTLRGISAERLFVRLHAVLGWSAQTSDKIRRELEERGKAVHVRLGSPSAEQLLRLGFEI
jgi:hypothetical protein